MAKLDSTTVYGNILITGEATIKKTLNIDGSINLNGDINANGALIMQGNIALKDNKLYLRTNGDNNHYLWNNSSDWEEMVAYSGTGFKISSSTGRQLAAFSGAGNIVFGTDTDDGNLDIRRHDDDSADHIRFYVGGTQVGEIGALDTTWLRINQHTGKNIYTPRYIRADSGFYVNGTSLGITGSGDGLFGSISGSSLNVTGSDDQKIILQGASNPYIRFRESTTDKAYIQWNSSGYLYLRNQEDGSGLRIRDGLDFTKDGTTFHSIFHEDNLNMAGLQDARTGSVTDAYMSPYLTKEAISEYVSKLIVYNSTTGILTIDVTQV